MVVVGRAGATRLSHVGLIKGLTFLMFMMFAMTTDSVGVIIPKILVQFHLDMTAAGAFHYATMGGIALAAIGLGFLADALGRKATIVLGLAMFALNSLLFAVGSRFGFFLILLFVSGLAIGVFKTGALALIGDISTSTRDHTTTMNAVEGFFGLGAIIGPAIVGRLLLSGASWKWLYVIAGLLCAVLMVVALLVKYPRRRALEAAPFDLKTTVRMMGDLHALAFSLGAMLYVGVETAIYVWMPTLLASDRSQAAWIATYALSVFFILRAGGRFLGSWLLSRLKWTLALVICSLAILVCFLGAVVLGGRVAVVLLPLSGLFMSVIYPTLNSKGISCFPKVLHGAVAGVILFFTCLAAVLGPLAMGALGDVFHNPRAGFVLAIGFAALLFAGLAFNWLRDPTQGRLSGLDSSEYAQA